MNLIDRYSKAVSKALKASYDRFCSDREYALFTTPQLTAKRAYDQRMEMQRLCEQAVKTGEPVPFGVWGPTGQMLYIAGQSTVSNDSQAPQVCSHVIPSEYGFAVSGEALGKLQPCPWCRIASLEAALAAAEKELAEMRTYIAVYSAPPGR